MDRRLIDYLPPTFAGTKEIATVMASEQPEIEEAWAAWRRVLDNLFVQTANEHGLLRWERPLRMLPRSEDTVAARRARLLLRFNERLPYTVRTLRGMLSALCGADGYTLTLEHAACLLVVGLPQRAVALQREVAALLWRVTPANLALGVLIRLDAPPPVRVRCGCAFAGIQITRLPQLCWTSLFEGTVHAAQSTQTLMQTTIPHMQEGGEHP